MKTVALNNRTLGRTIFVLAALGAFYYFRRRGGTVSSLVDRGSDAVDTARGWINRVAPSLTATQDAVTSGSRKNIGKNAAKSVSAAAQI